MRGALSIYPSQNCVAGVPIPKFAIAFVVSDVPAGTVRLAFNMIDKEVPSYHHGGGTLPYTGNGELAAGAFSFKGPCPPAGQRHSYEWSVQALDKGENVLASAASVAQFPP